MEGDLVPSVSLAPRPLCHGLLRRQTLSHAWPLSCCSACEAFAGVDRAGVDTAGVGAAALLPAWEALLVLVLLPCCSAM